jgi:hypothetical protein
MVKWLKTSHCRAAFNANYKDFPFNANVRPLMNAPARDARPAGQGKDDAFLQPATVRSGLAFQRQRAEALRVPYGSRVRHLGPRIEHGRRAAK